MCVCVVRSIFLTFRSHRVIYCAKCAWFSTVFLVSRKDVVSARGREIDTPHLHLLRMEWPRQTLLRRGFNTTHTLLSTRKATRKISGDVAQMVERSLRTMSFSRGNKPFFFFSFFFRGKEGDPKPKNRRTHITHTHTTTTPRDETRRDETRRDACARVRCNRRGRSRPSRFSSATWFSPPPAAAAAAHSQLHPCSILRSPPLYPPTLRRP